MTQRDYGWAGISRGHVAPFVAWVGVIFLLALLERFVALPVFAGVWIYAVKSVVCAVMFLWWSPWRIYEPLKAWQVAPAMLTGLAVAALWVAPETVWFGALCPGAQMFYYRWLILVPGTLPAYYDPGIFPQLPAGFAGALYDPALCGWPLAVMRLVGSALVIAVLEEFFFRGFLYRRLQCRQFWTVPPGRWHAFSFWMVVLVFGLEHDRWLAGMVAGAAYGALALRTGGVWAAALAHATTNAALAAYVLAFGRYGFW